MATTRQAIVVDASVLVKWFLRESYSDESLELRKQHIGQEKRIVVPALARFEVLNALKQGGLGTHELLRVARDLEDYQFVEVPLGGSYGDLTVQIAFDYGINIYDSSYVSLGKARQLRVVTADEELLERVGADFDFMEHIKKFGNKKEKVRRKS
jgi:predicted nucleic acid-binding protein